MLTGSLNQKLNKSSKSRLNYLKISAQKEHLNDRKKCPAHNDREKSTITTCGERYRNDKRWHKKMDLWKQAKLKKGNPILLHQFYFQTGVKMHRSRLDYTRPCTIVTFRVLLQNNIRCATRNFSGQRRFCGIRALRQTLCQKHKN